MTTDSSALPDLPAGIWRHYKGPRYLTLGYGHDSNIAGRDVVVYVGLQLDDAHPGPRLAVRTATDFLFEHMHRADSGDWIDCTPGCARVAEHVARFTYLGPSYDG